MCKHSDNPVDNRCRVRAMYVARYPKLAQTDPDLIDSFTNYRLSVEANDKLLSEPIVPDRITRRHPMAY